MTVYLLQEPLSCGVRAQVLGGTCPADRQPPLRAHRHAVPAHVVHAFRLAAPAGLDEQFTAWLAEAYQVGELPCNPERRAPCNSREPAELRATRQAYHRSAPCARARSEMHDMICPCLTYLDMQQAVAELSDVALGLADSDPALLTTKRRSARVVVGISPVMRAGHISLPDCLGVTPVARRAASRGGAQPAHLPRPPRPCRRHPHRKLVPARLGPLAAGCST